MKPEVKATTDEKRSNDRKRVLIPAKVYNLDGSILSKCVVRDASKGGCMIVSSFANEWPDVILVEVVHFKGMRKAKIIWRDSKAAGVKFD